MTPRFSILLPVLRPPHLMTFAIESVLAQTVADFELLVVCDGAPEETIACAREFGRADPRVKTFAFPKGERHGEANRNAALAQAAGRFVAHICDDDLWFPDHLAELERLLAGVDFGNVLHVRIFPGDVVSALACDLADAAFRRRFVDERFNRFGPTFCGYRMDAYRRLPEGWAPAPPDVWTDLHMWRKFLRRDDIKAATRAVVSAIQFPSPPRAAMSLEDRRRENERWSRRVRDPNERRAIVEAAIQSLNAECVRQERRGDAAAAAHASLQATSQAELARMKDALQAADAELRRLTGSAGSSRP